MNLIDFDHNFFGRKATLELLSRRVLDLKEGYRQNIAFLGGRFIGKTTILQKFIRDFDDPSVVIIYLDLENRDFGSCFIKFAKGLLYNYLKLERQTLHDDISLLMESCRGRIPQTVAAIARIQTLVQENKTSEAYQGLLSLPEILSVETGKVCVVIFDEFHHLDDYGIVEAFGELGKKIMTQKNCLYIFASSYEECAKKILAEKLSLLFGNFENTIIAPFDFTTSLGFIDHNLSGIKIGLQLKNFLADFTGGHPLYLSLISQELIYLTGVYGQQEIYAPIVSAAIENVIFNPWGAISRHFELLVSGLYQGKNSGSLVPILMSLANGKHKVQDLAQSTRLKPSSLTQKLNRLMEMDIVEKNIGYFHIKDKLLSFWIKYVFERRLKCVDVEPGKARKQFKEELSKGINDFQVVARKDLSSRMLDLIHRFDDESFLVQGRKYKLPIFTEVASSKMRMANGSCFDVIHAKGEGENWVLVLKPDPVHETDLVNFLNEYKKIEPKPQRCVLVTLSELDENAKIRALQERLWVWREAELNAFMHLYDEPYIVR